MGVDIHMHIVSSNKEMIYSDIWEGRDSEWFRNISGEGDNVIYDDYPLHYGVPFEIESMPEIIQNDYEWCYDFRYLTVKDFKCWYNRVRPDIDAGWISKKDAWLYKSKGIEPLNIYDDIPDECSELNWEFCVFQRKYEGSANIIKFLEQHNDIPNDAYIVYYFDC